MSGYVDDAGAVTQLDGRVAPDEIVTEKDVAEPPKLARLLVRVLRDIADLKRRFLPQRIAYRDVAVTGAAGAPQAKQFEHGFGGRVVWFVGDWSSSSTSACAVRKKSTTTDSTLVLEFMSTGTVTVVVEEAG